MALCYKHPYQIKPGWPDFAFAVIKNEIFLQMVCSSIPGLSKIQLQQKFNSNSSTVFFTLLCKKKKRTIMSSFGFGAVLHQKLNKAIPIKNHHWTNVINMVLIFWGRCGWVVSGVVPLMQELTVRFHLYSATCWSILCKTLNSNRLWCVSHQCM